jgi:hypothetical protein
LRVLRVLRPAIPDDWTVIVLTDRGLYARWLFRRIVCLGWHPFMRINRQGRYRLDGEDAFRLLSQVVTTHGQRWSGRVTCFKTRQRQLACTLLARHERGYRDPWLIVTDLAPTDTDIAWYALRTWVECGFKDSKRGGWQWQQTQMTDPRRAERLWLALAVAMLWTVSLGSVIEAGVTEDIADLPNLRRLLGGTGRQRCLQLFRLGWLWVLVRAIRAQPVPLPRQLVPEPWPGCWATNGGEQALPPN